MKRHLEMKFQKPDHMQFKQFSIKNTEVFLKKDVDLFTQSVEGCWGYLQRVDCNSFLAFFFNLWTDTN